ncbi:phage holin family protein [Paraburkholderia sp. CNPSo 3274]|uniref:phage holin family protein n=1 Tax=Paraburkholderia sp. CNPSo 3274 TaxID=2940932 RepID=UPI0020B8642C|nr:phage holin family protein [Paraburkholderia sp. CNPSo 3274]MCP3711582.1 phage holin family protein [Paraburkholderia sp. CNPSo 3274]
MTIHAKLDRWHNVLRFLAARTTDYGELLSLELSDARTYVTRELLALVALAVSGLFTLSFFCVALIASAWNTRYFLTVVWSIAGIWLIASITALLVSRAQRPVRSFAILKDELQADLETLKEALK